MFGSFCLVVRGNSLSKVVLIGCIALGLTSLANCTALGTPLVLSDQNSSITVDPTAPNTVSSWRVDGVEELKELSNWYRTGVSGGAEANLSSIVTGPFNPVDTLGDPAADQLAVTYLGPSWKIVITFAVSGAPLGSGISGMGEEIAITNMGGNNLPIHLFEYFDLDLTNTPNDDLITPTSKSTLSQTDGFTTVSGGVIDADHYEYVTVPQTLNKLGDMSATTLLDTPSIGTQVGPGNYSSTIQWDFVGFAPPRPVIPPGQTVVIKKTWNLEMRRVPEPGTCTLAVVAALGLFVHLKQRRRAD